MNSRGCADDDTVEELSFEDNQPPPRAGDPRVERGRADPLISDQRARNAGMSGGEIEHTAATDPLVTADDLSPETLLDEDAVDNDGLVVADKDLSIVDEFEIGGGSGLDEAELAQITGRPN